MESFLGNNNLLIPILTFSAVISLGGAIISGTIAYRKDLKTRLTGGQLSMGAMGEAPRPFSSFLSSFGKKFSSKEDESSQLRRQLAAAGYSGENSVTIYMGIKMLLFMCSVGGAATFVLALDVENAVKMLIVIFATAVGFFLPNFFVRSMAERRANEIKMHLPDAIDLLEICVSGGMGIDQAWNSVSDQLRKVSPLLADEMALTNLEIHLGAPRADAMRHMAERTGSEDITSLVGVLVQSEKFGTSIGDALRIFTVTMREQRSLRAEESAEKMSVKMLFPMVSMVFPVVIIIAVGPAALTISEVFGI
jgi:tight adherence protein C